MKLKIPPGWRHDTSQYGKTISIIGVQPPLPEIHYGEVGNKPVLPSLNRAHEANEDPEDTEGPARQLECDEDKERFEEKLKRIAKVNPKRKPDER